MTRAKNTIQSFMSLGMKPVPPPGKKLIKKIYDKRYMAYWKENTVETDRGFCISKYCGHLTFLHLTNE